MGDVTQGSAEAAAVHEGFLNPFFGKLLIGLSMPFAIFNGLLAVASHTSRQPTAGVLFMAQLATFLGSLIVMTTGLAAFHRTRSPYLKVGGGFLTILGLGMLIYICIMAVAV